MLERRDVLWRPLTFFSYGAREVAAVLLLAVSCRVTDAAKDEVALSWLVVAGRRESQKLI